MKGPQYVTGTIAWDVEDQNQAAQIGKVNARVHQVPTSNENTVGEVIPGYQLCCGQVYLSFQCSCYTLCYDQNWYSYIPLA